MLLAQIVALYDSAAVGLRHGQRMAALNSKREGARPTVSSVCARFCLDQYLRSQTIPAFCGGGDKRAHLRVGRVHVLSRITKQPHGRHKVGYRDFRNVMEDGLVTLSTSAFAAVRSRTVPARADFTV